MIQGACHTCKTPQCEWTSVRCSRGEECVEIFCFACLSKVYPSLYGSVFRGICWACPACVEACRCEACVDPVQKQERQSLAREFYKHYRSALSRKPQHTLSDAPIPRDKQREKVTEEDKEDERKGDKNKDVDKDIAKEGDENSWSCPRCSVLNDVDDMECTACCYHKRRSTRKRTVYSAPVYEERHSVQKEPAKRARETPYDDSSPPQRGRVSALRQLVKNPWIDNWDLARKLALDLVEEARQQAIRQGIPVIQVRQLPTKYQLANTRGTHVRKWFDREPTLAKKFLRAAGLTCSKSNGTFIREEIPSLDHMPPLIMKVDVSRFDENSSLSGDEADDPIRLSGSTGSIGSISASGGESCESSPTFSPSHPRSPAHADDYHPKMKVYYHRGDQPDPFVFKVPIDDLNTIDEVKDRLSVLLKDMGQTSPGEDSKHAFVLTGAEDASCVAQSLPCNTMDDLTRYSLLHVHAP